MEKKANWNEGRRVYWQTTIPTLAAVLENIHTIHNIQLTVAKLYGLYTSAPLHHTHTHTQNVRNKSFFDNFVTPSSATPCHFTSPPCISFCRICFFPILSPFYSAIFLFTLRCISFCLPFEYLKCFESEFFGVSASKSLSIHSHAESAQSVVAKLNLLAGCHFVYIFVIHHARPSRICYAVSPSDAT